ncbi:hypothetical protein [Rariglobus hedericola]|uniref:Molecular chaperone n=2 Tax=Rariglobus hedericola TaxID=2597822 RepID=A0A556QS83_9BACT|nr:hypothetical protein [Rariglobus hedericola]TSJ79504.1 hypothetical protein FPL22_09515 [Rariglobus hedericola]
MTASVLRPLFSVLCLLSTVALAQPDAPKPPKLRFLFIDESAGAYSLKLGTTFRQVSANPYEISAPYTPADVTSLDIYKTLADPVTGIPKPVKIASVTPSANTPSALVIITPRPPASPDVAPVYKVEFIDTNPALFPAGSIRIINRSPVSMAAQFSDSRVVTAPGETSLVQPATDSRHRVLFKIAIQVQQEAGGWQLIQDSMTVIRAKERMFGILVYSPGGMKHMLTSAELAEFGPPKPGCFWLTFSDTP